MLGRRRDALGGFRLRIQESVYTCTYIHSPVESVVFETLADPTRRRIVETLVGLIERRAEKRR